nr:AMP-binding protein [Burkholderia pseudomallei]
MRNSIAVRTGSRTTCAVEACVRDERVATASRRGLEMMIGMLAMLKAGGAYVPLDPGYPVGALAHMLLDSAPVDRARGRRSLGAWMTSLARLNAATPILDHRMPTIERWSAQPGGNLTLRRSDEPDVGDAAPLRT